MSAATKETGGFVTGVVTVDLPPIVEEPRAKYLVGLLPDAPFDYVTPGAIEFSKFTEEVTFGTDQETIRERRRGTVLELTDAQVERVKRDVVRKVVRKVGTRHDLYGLDSRKYSRQPGDRPLAHFVYMRRVMDGMPADWREGQQTPMA